jgi:SAM-dependent methyltransferase
MSETAVRASRTIPGPWPGWCCSYCAAPLEIERHGAVCPREGRWFATQGGVHRLLTQERRRELQPSLEAYQRVRRAEAESGGRQTRAAASFDRALAAAAARLGPGPWRVLDVGAGGCWASARLLALGHTVAAVDLDLDEQDGLLAASRILADPSALPRAEADMEALPLEPASMDLVLAAGVLHHAADLSRTLVELRRVTRRGGLLVGIGSPVYASAADGERAVADRAEAVRDRYGVPAMPFGRGYLVRDELSETFRRCAWRLEVHGGPRAMAEIARDAVQIARRGRRTARSPILIARRDG